MISSKYFGIPPVTDNKISKAIFDSTSFMYLPGWESVMGLQFENLVLNNLKKLLEILRINPSEVSNFGPFFQRKTQRMKGCQIDLLIQTKHNTLYVCEIKFSSSEVKSSVIEEMERKIESMSLPKGTSVRPVLIHVNGVSQSVMESETFNDIVDFSQFLDG